MFFKQVPVGSLQNFSYIIADQKAKIAAVVDPAFEEDEIFRITDEMGFRIKMVLLTHTHFDHMEAAERVVRRTDAAVYVHKSSKSQVENITSNIVLIDEGYIIKIGDVEVKALHTPGHTPGEITYLAGKKLITGDALFVEGCGRTDLAGGDIEIAYKTIQRFKSMPDDYEVYPGHDYGSQPHSTIAYEKKHNPYLLCSSPEEFFIKRG